MINSIYSLVILASTLCLSACGSEATTGGGAAKSTPPLISNVTGTITDGNTITINGSGFSAKTNPQPLFWWKADMGINPSSGLSRKTAWDSTFNGDISTVEVAPGSLQSVRWDHGASVGAALAKVSFGIQSTQVYLHRKLFEDFDVTTDFAIRTRVTGIACPNRGSPGLLVAGDVITGSTSGATGIVDEFFLESPHCTIYFKNAGGTINDPTPVDFVFGETMTTPGVATPMTNNEGSTFFPTGTLRSFNYKTVRFWNEAQQNNTYPVAQGAINAKFNINRENSDATLQNNNFLNPLSQLPSQWNTEEIVYKASSLQGVSDARFDFHQNGIQGSDQTFISRTNTKPNPYDVVFQSQVSNGAQLNSFVYYDSVYVDDSWHRVIICTGATANLCIDREVQIPKTWSDNQISVELNLGALNPTTKTLFLYVLNKDGIPNTNGKQITP